MDLLNDYGEDGGQLTGDAAVKSAYKPQPRLISTAPIVAAPATSGAIRAGSSAHFPPASSAGVASSSALVSYSASNSSITLHSSGSSTADPAASALQLAMTTGVLNANLPADQLWAPSVGPSNPHNTKRFVNDGKHTIAGSLASDALDGTSFENQYRSFMAHGVAANPTGAGGLVASTSAAQSVAAAYGAANVASARARPNALPAGMTVQVAKRARQGAGDVADVDGWQGPWAAYDNDGARRSTALERGALTDEQKRLRLQQGYYPDKVGKFDKDEPTPVITPSAPPKQGAAAAGAASSGGAPAPSPTASSASSSSAAPGARKPGKGERVAKSGTAALIEAGKGHVPGTAPAAGAGASSSSSSSSEGAPRTAADVEASASGGAGDAVGVAGTSSTFHGGDRVDYQGRPWCAAPKGVRSDGGEHECFIPKKPIAKFTGHSKGVQSIAFSPGTGHLLLSGSLDTKVKIWDVLGARQVRRTYLGHTGAVREVRFDSDGSRFASVSYDKSAKVWDVESGACTVSLAPGSVPYTGVWHPSDPHTLLLGCANRKVMQFDVRSGACVLEYSYHLGPVNAILFVDEDRRIVTSSDDKKLLVWEFGAPVPIKYIQDPAMHAIPVLAPHPAGDAFLGQCMDNSLMAFYAGEKVGINRKKVFRGHITAGFACAPTVSPDGAWVASGDGEGGLWFWDWKTTKMMKKIPRAHEGGPSIGMAWHPLQPSWVASCGWDGIIKLWD